MANVPLIDAEEGIEKDDCIENDFAYRNNVKNADLRIRLGFLRKVYSLLLFQLSLTTIIGFICIQTESLKATLRNSPEILLLCLLLNIVVLIGLHFKRKESPANFILLTAFTVIQAISIGILITFYDKSLVLQALVLTVTVVAGLTAFTFQSKKDFSSWGASLFALLLILIVAGFLQIIFRSPMFELVISMGGALIFSLFIIYDTHEIMKKLSAEEYILATITLYLDIINLFIYILRILQASRRN